MRFPTPEFLEDLERGGPVMDILMPELTPREAWLLNQFLEEVHEALWDAYAEDILDYQDRQDFPDLHPPEDSEPTPPSGLDPWTGPNIPF